MPQGPKKDMAPEFIDQWPGRPVIRFYETNKPYGCFSNFAAFVLEIDGIIWPTSEHYFQAMKFTNTAYRAAIRGAPKAFEAARFGRERSQPIRDDWNEVRGAVMLKALKAKFEQHDDLRAILLSTNGALIVEHTASDAYWGDGGDGSGRNMLGELLMEVRDSYHLESIPEFQVPHWVRFPKIARSDMFWRMGLGEGIASKFALFRNSLPPPAQMEFDRYFPEPGERWER
jgi:N-glycosidase YbiA